MHRRMVMLAAAALAAATTGATAATVTIPGDNVFPESMTQTSDGTLYFSSIGQGAIFVAPPGASTAKYFVKPNARLRSVTGVLADEKSHTLYACTNDWSMFGVTTPGGKGPPAVKAFDLRTGADKGTYEFPGKSYDKKKTPDDVVVVTYSSISTNGFENYGECVMGTRGTLIVEKEESVMLFPENQPGKVKTPARGTEVGVSASGKDKPVLESGSTWGGPSVQVTGTSVGPPVRVSRGYTEEMEDFAYCVRQWDPQLGYEKETDGKYKQRLTRCHGEIAMVDAIIALTANHAMKTHQRIEFRDAWFDADKDDVPPGELKAKVEIA